MPSAHRLVPPAALSAMAMLEPLSPEQAAPLVPPYVARTQTDFRRCTRCRRVYWPGTHWQGLQAWGDRADESD